DPRGPGVHGAGRADFARRGLRAGRPAGRGRGRRPPPAVRYTWWVLHVVSTTQKPMSLSAPVRARQPIHTRSIRVDSYLREDGLWDLQAELVDTKAYDFPIRNGDTHCAGDPVHHMRLRVTIDDDLNI